MANQGDAYSKRALDFVQKLQALNDYKEICQLITRELEWFGLTCVTSWTLPGPGSELRDGIALNTRPDEYTKHYDEKKYVLRDPLVNELRTTLNPYSWSDVRARRKLNKSQKAIIDEASEFEATDGLVIPIVTLSGSTSLFAPCGLKPNLSPRARAAIEIIGIYSHLALRRALLKNKRQPEAHTPLSPREREVMQWVAAGKSDDEIAAKLKVSSHTVLWHVESAKRKLDALKRPYAVVQAIRFGEITL